MAGSEVQQEIERTRALADRARAVLENLTEEQVHRRPEPDRWSVGECFVHMNRANRPYLDALEPAVRRLRAEGRTAEGPFRYGWFEEWFVRQASPPATRRFKAPKVFQPPAAETVDASDTRREFFALLDRLEAVLRDAEGLDLTAAKVTSPVTRLVKLRLGPAFRLLTGHTERHLIQAQGAREAILKEAS
ncbi:MAG TPA: DinB family protein [bacterium]|nr:DinB family protein [bacterium]